MANEALVAEVVAAKDELVGALAKIDEGLAEILAALEAGGDVSNVAAAVTALREVVSAVSTKAQAVADVVS